MNEDYQPVITRLPAALEDEKDQREAAAALLAEQERAKQLADAQAADAAEQTRAAVEARGAEEDRERLARESE